MKPPKNINYSDSFQTPDYVLDPIIPLLKPDWIIWESAVGKGNLAKRFKNEGFRVIGTDINTGQDFLNYEPDNYDCIITNPPYSLKNEYLDRCYKLDRPFALLLPITTLETDYRQRLFKQYGVEIILFNKRINYETPSGKGSGAWFASAWFTWGLGIGKQLYFYDLTAETNLPLFEE